jgi:hypothetical protein
MRLCLCIVLALSTLLTGCAYSKLDNERYRYHPMGWGGGHEVKAVSADVYSVVYAGTNHPSWETVQTFWLYRAATLAREKGVWGFQILSLNPALSSGKYINPKATSPCDIVATFGNFNYPSYRGTIRLVSEPSLATSTQSYSASLLLAAIEPYVTGSERCPTGNVIPHEKPYLVPAKAGG